MSARTDRRGRLRVYLGRSRTRVPGWRRVRITITRNGSRRRSYAWVHPACNSGGWQWAGRYLWWERNGRRAPRSLHMHHRDHDRTNNAAANFEPLRDSEHGRLHARQAKRDGKGRFLRHAIACKGSELAQAWAEKAEAN